MSVLCSGDLLITGRSSHDRSLCKMNTMTIWIIDSITRTVSG
uniref:Uncharacterized protein n=1 Tax=viral metagenome TaxID=1070528 RepID=A0A6C0BNP7_9ZZZZ